MGILGDVLGFFGGNADRNAQKDMNYENNAMQREFAQSGVTWRVEDAKRAGISPLAALGAQLYNATPSYMASPSSRSETFRDMGQSLERAASATMNRGDRVKKEQMDALLLEEQSLKNEVLRGQVTRAGQATNPAMPTDPALSVIPGQGDAFQMSPGGLLPPPTTVSEKPFDRTMSDIGNSAKEAGIINDYQFVRRGDGAIGLVPSQDSKQRMEDMGPMPWVWYAKNMVNPPAAPPKSMLPPNTDRWVWNPLTFSWTARANRNTRKDIDVFKRGWKW